MTDTRFSIIIPVLNESAGLAETLQMLQPLRTNGAQVLVVDGGSTDETLTIAEPLADSVLKSPASRSRQMNTGAMHACGDVLIFLHADTRLPAHCLEHIDTAIRDGARWGRFDVTITGQHWMLPVIAFMMNWRSRLTGIATGDQAIFMQRSFFNQLGGFSDQPLMEDIELSVRLRKVARPACLRPRAVTSGRRWETRGVWRTILLMWQLRWCYWRGDSPHHLAKRYR
ncbi:MULTISPECIES: TIGR04283 family arsenosugar biosynthesis glycosyltransferase [Alcaligenaceae]|uniref:TIGR04283 family arsenosugar biosynthesis glycosyltransferase n=1 Tax=Alcaligenaceae TaxID=506 RepID=UPI0022B4374D|nr:TIGR04283 family arsenosugar biosynthesis glycosyltransferase [Castellaniella sp. S9]